MNNWNRDKVNTNSINFIKRKLNSAPVFISELQSLTVTYCKSTSYLLPSVVDYDGDNYSISATLYNGSPLPSWIYFDSRKVVILLPKGTDPNINYDLKIRLTDSKGLYTEYKLTIIVDNNPLQLKSISDVSIVSPQVFNFTYDKILSNSYNYDLNSSILLINSYNNFSPYWIRESKSEYVCSIDTSFNQKDTIDNCMHFEITDYCGDNHYTNTFKLTVLPNNPPVVNNVPSRATFYKGQTSRTISTPINMFIDPGDSLTIYTTLCLEKDSQQLRTYYNETENCIYVDYPKTFVNTCTLAVVAKDTAKNINLSMLQIVIEQCFQSMCAVCTGSQMHDCTECIEHHIMNLNTKECIPILSIYSIGSVKFFGMLCFFFLLIYGCMLTTFRLFIKKDVSFDVIMSIISMIQTVLIVSHYDNNISSFMRTFLDGFQYFKFEFRFLNIVLYISSNLNGKNEFVPNRMYSLFFEYKSAYYYESFSSLSLLDE